MQTNMKYSIKTIRHNKHNVSHIQRVPEHFIADDEDRMLGWVSRKESRDNALRTLQANIIII
jgi:hypothetical protein